MFRRSRLAGVYQPPSNQQDNVVTNLLEIRHSLNEATSSTLQQFIHSSSVSNISTQQTGASASHQQQHHHHHHYPHLHLHGAGSFLRDNFVSSSASSALNAIMGHHHQQQSQLQQTAQPQGQVSNFSASPTNLCHVPHTTTVPMGSVSAGGSHSAGVVGCISFSSAEPMPLAYSNSSTCVTPTPPLQRRLAKSFSVAPSITQQKGAVSLIVPHVISHFLICSLLTH